MVRKQSIIALLLTLAVSFSACATLITGKQQVIHVVSNPPGAEVHFFRILAPEFIPNAQWDSMEKEPTTPMSPRMNFVLDSNIHCITPCYVRVPRLQTDTLAMRVEMTGYQSVTHRFKKKWNEASALNFVIPWNWMIDANNSAVIRYPQPDTFLLQEVKKRQ
ncbi:MAG: hypothetical protein ACKO67_02230 [Bacteroidota bacterium]